MNEFAVTAPIVKTVLVTPELAAKWLSNNPNNRSVSRMVVQKYARIMKAGGWYLTPSGILLGRGEMLLDGQHRLEAIIESGESVFMTVFYDVDPEAVDYVDIGRHRSTTHVAERYGFKNSALLVTALHDVGEIMFGGATNPATKTAWFE